MGQVTWAGRRREGGRAAAEGKGDWRQFWRLQVLPEGVYHLRVSSASSGGRKGGCLGSTERPGGTTAPVEASAPRSATAVHLSALRKPGTTHRRLVGARCAAALSCVTTVLGAPALHLRERCSHLQLVHRTGFNHRRGVRRFPAIAHLSPTAGTPSPLGQLPMAASMEPYWHLDCSGTH